MDDPRDSVLDSINIAKTRVAINAECKIVLLFGGKFLASLEGSAKHPSIRSLIKSYSKLAFEVFLPEEIQEWNEDAIYQNLVDYEKDLAGICNLLVIIPESAGSIAELGMFSQLVDHIDRVIIVSSVEYDEKSFLDVGLYRYLRRNRLESVKKYPLPKTPYIDGVVVEEDVLSDIVSDIEDELKLCVKTELFRSADTQHIFAAIYHFLKIFVILKLSEIKKYLYSIGVDIDRNSLNSKLFLMKRFGLVLDESYSTTAYYFLNKKNDYHSLNLSFHESHRHDDIRVMSDSVEYYTNVLSEKRRLKIYRKYYG
ncbi:MAG: hypothetical protein ACJA2K_001745 [Thalassolituus sp.]|jgi:hypothetical protein